MTSTNAAGVPVSYAGVSFTRFAALLLTGNAEQNPTQWNFVASDLLTGNLLSIGGAYSSLSAVATGVAAFTVASGLPWVAVGDPTTYPPSNRFSTAPIPVAVDLSRVSSWSDTGTGIVFQDATRATAPLAPTLGYAPWADYPTANAALLALQAQVQGGYPYSYAPINALNYGADPTGTTDSTAALTAAVNADTGSSPVPVYVPPGTYQLTNQVRLGVNGLRFQGAGMYSTTLQATTASTMLVYGLTYVPTIEISDMTLDGNNIATLGIGAYGSRVGRVIIRRCRFINQPATAIQFGQAANYVVEDCIFEGGGTGKGSSVLISGSPFESLSIRRNKMAYMYQGIVIGSTGEHASRIEICDNDIDGGWYLLKAGFTGSGGTVTYTSTGLTDTGAAFSGIATTSPSQWYARALNPRQSSTFTAISGTAVTDSAASYIVNGVKRGEIIRSGTVFGVVANVESATTIHVEEWLDQTTYLPAAPPVVGASYVAYAIYLGTITAFTSTTLTVEHGAGGGGGGWFDLSGAAQTPPSGCLYEVLSAAGAYPVFVNTTTEKIIVSRNRVRRGRYDNMELFGNQIIITDNIVEDGQDEGIVFQGASTASPGLWSVIQGNICSHNGSSGLYVGQCANVDIGPNEYFNNSWTAVSTRNVGQVSLNNATSTTITAGRAVFTTESTPTVGLNITGASTAGIKVIGFTGSGHSVGDVYVTSNVPAAVCDLLDVDGVIAYQTTTNGQRIRVKGTGSPVGSVQAAPGSVFLRTDGSAGATLYDKASGDDTSGWEAQAGGGSSNPIGNQTEYQSVTGSVTYASVTGSYSAVTGAPSITLPNDGYTYRVECTIPAVTQTIAGILYLSLGTATNGILGTIQFDAVASARQQPVNVTVQKVVGSGQTITLYALCSADPSITLVCGAGGASSTGPIELAAYRVA